MRRERYPAYISWLPLDDDELPDLDMLPDPLPFPAEDAVPLDDENEDARY